MSLRRPVTSLVGCAALLGSLVAAPSARAAVAGESTVVVGLTDGAAGAAIVARLDGRPDVTVAGSRPVEGLSAVTVDVPAAERDAALAALRADPAVRYAEPDAVAAAIGAGLSAPAATAAEPAATAAEPVSGGTARRLAAGAPTAKGATAAARVVATDPWRGSQQALDRHRIQAAWQWTTGSPDVTVAVVDSGVSSVADLDGDRLLPGRDIVDGDDDAADGDGHGTLVAGVIAATANNDVAGAGVCWSCRILPVRVLTPVAAPGEGAAGSYSDVAAGIAWAADHGADVINLALGGTQDGQILRDAVAHARAAGAVVVAAAGNRAGTERFYPAAIDGVIAVGATLTNDRPSYGSNYNSAADPWIDLVALGEAVTADHKGHVRYFTGTSAAASLVAGAAALARSLRPDAAPEAVTEALVTQAAPLTTWVGAKRLDAGAAVAAWGEPDGTAPTVDATGLSDGQLLCGCAYDVVPTVDDDRDVSRVELLVDGAPVGADDIRPFSLPWRPGGLDGPVTVTVRAYDDSGNVGTADTTVRVDSTPPDAQIIAPVENADVSGIVSVQITSNASDVGRIVVRESALDATGRPRPWTLGTNMLGVPDGPAVISAYVFDKAGNRTALSRPVRVDTAAPVINLKPAEFARVFSKRAVFTPTVTDGSLRSRMELLVDGAVVARDDAAPFQLSWDGVARYNGAVRLTFRAIDGAGLSTEVVRTIRADNRAPTVRTVAPANGGWVRGTFTATATGVSDPSGIERMKLFVGGRYVGSDAGYPYAITAMMPAGRPSVPVRWVIVDKAGNETVVDRTVRRDDRAPTVAVTKGPANRAKVRGTVTLSVSAGDAQAGIARVELLVGGKVVATDATAGYRLSVNTAKQKKTMKIRVRAYDRAGNVAYTSTRTWRRR